MSFEPLKGVRVLDLTSVVVGPVCTWRLGQYGAEIIKVESPEGDLMRGLGGLSPTGQHSGAYLHFNRGKRNISLDLKKDRPNTNGIVRGWFDGKLVIDRTNVVLRSTDFPKMKFNQFLLTPYFGPGLLPHTQTLWIDELAVGTKRLGSDSL